MIKDKNKKVFVGISGGVDSSTSAALLKKQGYDVTGVFIKVWQPDFIECQWKEDRLDAMRVCADLEIPFLDLDLEEEYKRDVFDYMVSEYKQGKTPNPDVMCNKKIKFGGFLDFAKNKGADFIATGHYVRLQDKKLLVGIDKGKDQSYFLWALKQNQLKHCLFPVGQYEKTKVRRLAKKFGLVTTQKKDSQGLCFVGKVNMKEFLQKFIPQQAGHVLNTEGEVIGVHEGIFFYTIGQRHGFEIREKGTNDKPYYVVKKDLEKNELIVSNIKRQNILSEKSEALEIEIKSINWISGETPDLKKSYQARVRYRQTLQKCKLIIKGKGIFVVFDKFQNVDSGQSVVVYDGQVCLGGGVIV
ncbi:MAG: tRNA 2-thiouridine(34) synthase MnmA [Patescibacteria group bacterium]|nr:tRNA 2-thiouridine(34) synthase MnmA [Patescibacteria group bacterium]